MACGDIFGAQVQRKIIEIVFIEEDAGHAGIENHRDGMTVEVEVYKKR